MKEFPFEHGDEFFVEGAAVTVDTVLMNFEGGRSWVRSRHPRFI